jgi:hypothetical protein
LGMAWIIRAAFQHTPGSVRSSVGLSRVINFATAGIALWLIAVLALVSLSAIQLSKEWGLYKAELVRGGTGVFPSTLYGILNIRAMPVCITRSIDGTQILVTERPVMYLGQSGGMIAVYDTRDKIARRMPSANMEINNYEGGDCSITNSPVPSSTTVPATPSQKTTSAPLRHPRWAMTSWFSYHFGRRLPLLLREND